jgi:hypothetical protein
MFARFSTNGPATAASPAERPACYPSLRERGPLTSLFGSNVQHQSNELAVMKASASAIVEGWTTVACEIPLGVAQKAHNIDVQSPWR